MRGRGRKQPSHQTANAWRNRGLRTAEPPLRVSRVNPETRPPRPGRVRSPSALPSASPPRRHSLAPENSCSSTASCSDRSSYASRLFACHRHLRRRRTGRCSPRCSTTSSAKSGCRRCARACCALPSPRSPPATGSGQTRPSLVEEHAPRKVARYPAPVAAHALRRGSRLPAPSGSQQSLPAEAQSEPGDTSMLHETPRPHTGGATCFSSVHTYPR